MGKGSGTMCRPSMVVDTQKTEDEQWEELRNEHGYSSMNTLRESNYSIEDATYFLSKKNWVSWRTLEQLEDFRDNGIPIAEALEWEELSVDFASYQTFVASGGDLTQAQNIRESRPNFDFETLAVWLSQGYSVDEATPWVTIYMSPDDREELEGLGLSYDEISEWKRQIGRTDQIKDFMDAGLDAEQAYTFRRNYLYQPSDWNKYLKAKMTLPLVSEYLKEGVRPHNIIGWHKLKVKPEDVRTFERHTDSKAEVKEWLSKYSVTDAAAWLQTGYSFGTVARFESEGVSLDFVNQLNSSGNGYSTFGASSIIDWHKTGLNVDEIIEWQNNGTSADPSDENYYKPWKDAGWAPEDVKGWAFAGSPDNVVQWKEMGLDNNHAYNWAQSGITPRDARQYMRQGIDSESFRQWRRRTNFDHKTTAFCLTHDISMGEALNYEKIGVSFEHAVQYKAMGVNMDKVIRYNYRRLTPQDLIEMREEGLRPTQLEAWTNEHLTDEQADDMYSNGVSAYTLYKRLKAFQ